MTLPFSQLRLYTFEILCTSPGHIPIQPALQFSAAFYNQSKIFLLIPLHKLLYIAGPQ